MTDEQTRRNVIKQWISGFPRDTIAEQNKIGAGTVSSIIANYKAGLEELDFDSIRQLAVEARQHRLNLSELASHFRLYNHILKSGASENAIESFVTNVSSNDIPPERAIELVYQLHEISKAESIPLDHVPGYMKQKLEERQKIDEQIKEADAILRSKNVNIEAINEHIQLNEKLHKHRLSTKDIHKLLNLLAAAKEYRYNPGKIVAKLRNIKRLENKENKLKNSCEMLSKKEIKYKEIINEAAETYDLTPSAAALHVINLIKDYDKRGHLKRELSELTFQKYAINKFCSSRSQTIMALMNLHSHGLTEDRILQLNNFLDNNSYKDVKSTS